MNPRICYLTIVLVALAGLAELEAGYTASALIGPGSYASSRQQKRVPTTTVPQTPIDKTAQGTRGPIQDQTQPPKPVPGRPPDIEISAMPNPVMAGETVTVTVRLIPLVLRGQSTRSILVVPRVEYRYAFGDGAPTEWTSSSQMTHIYQAPNDYRAAAQIRLVADGPTARPGPARTTIITVTPKPVVASPSPSPSPSPSASVTPSASPSASPGDSPSPSPSPSESPSASPSDIPSPSPSEIAVAGQTTPPASATIDRRRPEYGGRRFPWLILALVLLVTLFVGYRIVKWVYAPRPVFTTLPDHSPRTKVKGDGSEPPRINFQLMLNANLADSQYQFHTNEPQLITYLRRVHD